MKKIIINAIICVFLFTGIANAWTLIWDSSGENLRYKVTYNLTNAVPEDATEVDVGENTFLKLDETNNINLIVGTQYDFSVIAYEVPVNAGETGAESMPSDTLRWTFVNEPIIIQILSAPAHFMIRP